MKVFLFFAVLILGFFLAITAAVKPETIEQHYNQITAPLEDHMAEKEAKLWQEAKQAEKAAWMVKLKLPGDCATTRSAIRELECRNQMQLHAQAFEQAWSAKVAGGWKPE